jgi:hypothetical protein
MQMLEILQGSKRNRHVTFSSHHDVEFLNAIATVAEKENMVSLLEDSTRLVNCPLCTIKSYFAGADYLFAECLLTGGLGAIGAKSAHWLRLQQCAGLQLLGRTGRAAPDGMLDSMFQSGRTLIAVRKADTSCTQELHQDIDGASIGHVESVLPVARRVP